MKRKEELLRIDEMFRPHPPFGHPLPEEEGPRLENYGVWLHVRTFGILLLFLFQSTVAFAEVIDRIVAVVDGQIITLSDLRQERAIRALLQEKPIDDDRTLARQLVDAQLIERQIADYPNIDVT